MHPKQKNFLAARMSLIGIVIPGSQIPGLAKPKFRDFGIEKNCIFQLKTAYIPLYLL